MSSGIGYLKAKSSKKQGSLIYWKGLVIYVILLSYICSKLITLSIFLFLSYKSRIFYQSICTYIVSLLILTAAVKDYTHMLEYYD